MTLWEEFAVVAKTLVVVLLVIAVLCLIPELKHMRETWLKIPQDIQAVK